MRLTISSTNRVHAIQKLRIVGAGSEREVLEQYVKDNGLQDNVAFHGAIYDEKEILKIFQQSLLCFSPTQAGLSVPKSMGYGVPSSHARHAYYWWRNLSYTEWRQMV